MVRKIGYSIIQLILLTRNYGFTTGFFIWIQIAISFSDIISIRSSLFKNKIYLRRKDSDLDIFNQVFVERQYKWHESNLLNPRIILDAGANVGLAAVYFSQLYPEAQVYCIEPDEENISYLQKNTSSYKNVQVFKAAVWHRNEPLQVTNPEGFSAGLALSASSDVKGITGFTMAEIMRHFNLSDIDILKMDIEGAEKEVFEFGDNSWLNNVKILVIELHDMYKEGTAKAFFAALHQRFHKMYFQGENIVCYLS